VTYKGSSKHKLTPHISGLPPFRGHRGDRTLCSKHASFSSADRKRVPVLLERALGGQLVGSHIWTVDDNGWIYELSVTNVTTHEHHGYPLPSSEAIAELFSVTFRNGLSRTAPRATKRVSYHTHVGKQRWGDDRPGRSRLDEHRRGSSRIGCDPQASRMRRRHHPSLVNETVLRRRTAFCGSSSALAGRNSDNAEAPTSGAPVAGVTQMVTGDRNHSGLPTSAWAMRLPTKSAA
jgi:hypothetical protein